MSLTNLEHTPTLHGHGVGCVCGVGWLSPHGRLANRPRGRIRFRSLAKGPTNSVGSRLFSKYGSTGAYILESMSKVASKRYEAKD